MLSAAVHGKHERGFAFTGFVARVFGLYSNYIFACCLPALLAIVECLFASTLPTLSYLHRVTLVIMSVGKYYH